jgi:hypothetical protein
VYSVLLGAAVELARVHRHAAEEEVVALVAVASTVAPSLEDFTVAQAPSFEDLMATTTDTTTTATTLLAQPRLRLYYAFDDSYYDNGSCYVVHRRVHTAHGRRLQPRQVCG